MYKGFREITEGELANYYQDFDNLHPKENEFFILEKGEKLRYKQEEFRNVIVKRIKSETTEVTHRNSGQEMALDLLLDDDVKLVALTGKAGCGKTYLAAQIGLHKVVDKKKYDKLFFVRNNVEIAKSLGALPGEKFDKIKPYMSSIVDQLGGWDIVEYLTEYSCKLEAEALGFMQGRSLNNTFIIVDEAQNLTVPQVKMLATRVAEGSKMVMAGDLQQAANDTFQNGNSGLKTLIEKFCGHRLFGFLELQESERSELAQLAADLL